MHPTPEDELWHLHDRYGRCADYHRTSERPNPFAGGKFSPWLKALAWLARAAWRLIRRLR